MNGLVGGRLLVGAAWDPCPPPLNPALVLSAIISSELRVRSSPKFLCMLPMAVARSSSDVICTSGFMYDVIFAHKPRLFDVATQLKRSARAALGLAIKSAQ